MFEFQPVIAGRFYVATSPVTGEHYTIRTRPLNDGWMAIADGEGLVIGTKLSFSDAKSYCESYDKLIDFSQVRL
jgi:hypothetical protein